ncbi:MAG: isoleucine--tRNA ligase [Bacilli bacterium]|nr:isoleucine--tRNA ligase [Bacilli bacterium]
MELKDTLLMPKTGFEMRGNLTRKEPDILARWNDINLYQLMLEKNKGKKYFILHDGPPYANGNIHSGHMLNRNLKDFVVRLKNMQGYNTPFIMGWDTHGLPIENQITKSGVNRKELSVAAFRKLCEEYALKQVEMQKNQIRRLGIVGDYDNAYITLTKDYEADELEVFKSMALNGLIYRGLKPVHWSPSSETALAEAEIEYQDVVSDAIYVAFAVTKGNNDVPVGAKFVIWTTTPWTLPANLGISVHPRFMYGLYESNVGQLVLLNDLAHSFTKETGVEVNLIKSFKGQSLDRLETRHPLFDRMSLVMVGDHVTSETGTGAVHTAPGHGMEDFIIGQKYGLEVLCPVNERGVFTEEAGKYAGMFYESANKVILDDLTAVNALLGAKKLTHSYPHDWRTNKPLIFRATPQWFASISPIRKSLLKAVKKVHWYPKWGENRLANMIKDRGDWTISRQRVWGVPIPIIYNEDGSPILEEAVFDNIIKEVKEHGTNIWFEKDAKYFLSEGYVNPSSPNGNFTKEQDIMDVWFDSGTSAIHTLKKHNLPFPADLYLEGNDQYRGWFNSSLTLSVAVKGESPYKTVLTHGFVVDEKNIKMSKSKGNVLDPSKLANEYGADILRLWTATIDYQEDAKLSVDLLKQTSETYRKIRNTFKFMLGNLPSPEAPLKDIKTLTKKPTAYIDLLMLAKLDKVVNKMLESYNDYDFGGAFTHLMNFVTNELSSFYLDITKDILYCEKEDGERRLSAVRTLYKISTTLLPLIAPILAFTAEEIYTFLPVVDRLPSVHLLGMPRVQKLDEEKLLSLEKLLDVRASAYQVLEAKRKDGVLGSSQEALLVLNKEDTNLEDNVKALAKDELARLFIVSEVKLGDGLSVTKHQGEKCPRCWNYHDTLVSVKDHHVCERCASVVKDYE